MNKDFRDGENKAYAVLIEFLWDSGDLSSFDSPEEAIEGVLRDFLEPERVNEVLETLVKPLEPPSEDGWYLVKVKTPNGEEERKLYYCHRYVRGCDPWWKGFLCYGDTPVRYEAGINENEKAISWSKVSSGDRVECVESDWVNARFSPGKSGYYKTVRIEGDEHIEVVSKFNIQSGWVDKSGGDVYYWKPLPDDYILLKDKRPCVTGYYLTLCSKKGFDGETHKFFQVCYFLLGKGWYLNHQCHPGDDYDYYVDAWVVKGLKLPED